MTDQRWQRVQELYHAALERDADERSAFLERACSNDDVRREVESLLGYEGQEHDILNKPAWAPPDATVSDITPALGAGRLLGSYQIVERLGVGGMGEVYRARDLKLKREVAIKVLPEALARNPERMARFSREAQVLASMNHPNIAAIYGLEESDGVRALVMELVEGPTLAERVARGAIPVDEALPLARQIAEALEYAHDKGIVHRDLKPANIKVTPEGTTKVLDFGLAKAVEQRPAQTDPENAPTVTQATLAGVILGTPAYMPPEQARGKPVDRRADIWAFGAVVYEMLTGRGLFGGETLSDTLARVMTKEPDWEALPQGTPARIRRLLERCLRKDPKTRLQAIGEARIAIDEKESEPAGVMPSAPRRNIPWMAGTALIIISAVLAAGWWHAARPVMRPMIRLRVDLGADPMDPYFRDRVVVALSPDGTRLALTMRASDGKQRLMVRLLDQDQLTPLAGTEGATGPFFSPDGQSIGFFADYKLKTISVQGGAPATLFDVGGSGGGPRGGSWGDDGNIILALAGSGGLSSIPASGGTPKPVTQLKLGEATHRWPQVLPGSETIVFTAHSTLGNYDDATVEVLSLKTGLRKTVVRGGYWARYLSSGYLVYVHESTLFAAPFNLAGLAVIGEPIPIVEEVTNSRLTASFDVSQTGTMVYFGGPGSSIFWLDSSGNMRPLQPPPGIYSDPRFSPDGKRLAFSRRNGSGADIWARDLERDSLSRLSFLPGENRLPLWSPDGKYILFRSVNPTAPGIYCIRADGSSREAQRLTVGKRVEQPASFSPDGKRLAIVEHMPDEISVCRLEGTVERLQLGEPESFLRTPFSTRAPAFSPDGRWLAYSSTESGRSEVYVRPFPGPGGLWQVSTGGGNFPAWSRDGRKLFFESLGHIMVSTYSVKGDSFVAGHPSIWWDKTLHPIGTLRPYDVAPDGERIAGIFTSPNLAGQAPSYHVTFLLNFFDELRRRVPSSSR